jgi:hypothetical protein
VVNDSYFGFRDAEVVRRISSGNIGYSNETLSAASGVSRRYPQIATPKSVEGLRCIEPLKALDNHNRWAI